MAESAYVLVDRDDNVVHIQLNRPERLNAVSEDVYDELEIALETVKADPSVRAVLLSGAGRAFCAGADLKAHAHRRRTMAERRAYVWAGQRVCRLLQQMPVPIVAAVHGHAVGAGAELAMSSDIIVCAKDLRFAFPEVGLGTFVGGGASQRLPLLVGQIRARELLLMGRTLSGEEAVGWGLATEAVDGDTLVERAREIAAQVSLLPPVSVGLVKQTLGLSGSLGLEEAMVIEAEGLLACMGTEEWADAVKKPGISTSGGDTK